MNFKWKKVGKHFDNYFKLRKKKKTNIKSENGPKAHFDRNLKYKRMKTKIEIDKMCMAARQKDEKQKQTKKRFEIYRYTVPPCINANNLHVSL